jgi:hypothetical protein
VHSEDDDDASPDGEDTKKDAVDDDDDRQTVPVPSNRPVRRGEPKDCDTELKMYCGDKIGLRAKAKVGECLDCVKTHMSRIDRGLKTVCDEDTLAVMCDPQMVGKSDKEAARCESKATNTCGYDVEKAAGCNKCMATHNFKECNSFQQSYFCYFYTWGSDSSDEAPAADDHLAPPSGGPSVTHVVKQATPINPGLLRPSGRNPSCAWALSVRCSQQFSDYKDDASAMKYVSCLKCAGTHAKILHLGCK